MGSGRPAPSPPAGNGLRRRGLPAPFRTGLRRRPLRGREAEAGGRETAPRPKPGRGEELNDQHRTAGTACSVLSEPGGQSRASPHVKQHNDVSWRGGARLVRITCSSEAALRRRGRLVREDRAGGVQRCIKQVCRASKPRKKVRQTLQGKGKSGREQGGTRFNH